MRRRRPAVRPVLSPVHSTDSSTRQNVSFVMRLLRHRASKLAHYVPRNDKMDSYVRANRV